MTFDGSLLELMPDQVTIEPFVSESSARVITYGAAVTYQAQVLPYVERVTDAVSGRDVKSALQVIVPEQLSVDPRSRLTIISPAGFTPATPPIRAIRPLRNLGLDHTQILAGGG